MNKFFFILSTLIFLQVADTKAQGLSPGECGIMFTYDATGSLIQRVFFCNNTGAIIYQATRSGNNQTDSVAKGNNPESLAKEEIIKVNALMPNPTTGQFTVRLAKALKNENVLIMDENGKIIQKSKKSGSELNFDIGSSPAGIYFLKIESNGKRISLKIIKQ